MRDIILWSLLPATERRKRMSRAQSWQAAMNNINGGPSGGQTWSGDGRVWLGCVGHHGMVGRGRAFGRSRSVVGGHHPSRIRWGGDRRELGGPATMAGTVTARCCGGLMAGDQPSGLRSCGSSSLRRWLGRGHGPGMGRGHGRVRAAGRIAAVAGVSKADTLGGLVGARKRRRLGRGRPGLGIVFWIGSGPLAAGVAWAMLGFLNGAVTAWPFVWLFLHPQCAARME